MDVSVKQEYEDEEAAWIYMSYSLLIEIMKLGCLKCAIWSDGENLKMSDDIIPKADNRSLKVKSTVGTLDPGDYCLETMTRQWVVELCNHPPPT